MSDDRLVQRLEEQLRDAHATNADLRDRLGDIEKREHAANVIRVEGRDALAQLEKLQQNRRQPKTTPLRHSASAMTRNARRSVPTASLRSYAIGSRS
jgi:septal ring factor EnvC (AmiA/AmiB activator)